MSTAKKVKNAGYPGVGWLANRLGVKEPMIRKWDRENPALFDAILAGLKLIDAPESLCDMLSIVELERRLYELIISPPSAENLKNRRLILTSLAKRMTSEEYLQVLEEIDNMIEVKNGQN